MASGKTSKRVRETAMNPDNWSTVERLILSQAIYEFGTENMPQVATLLESHAMTSRSNNFFTAETCTAVYEKLMEEANITRPDTVRARAPESKQLATMYYQKRTAELKIAIDEEESKFKQIMKEIEEIRAGHWDDRILQAVGVVPATVNNATEEDDIVEEDVRMTATLPDIADASIPEAPATSANGSRLPSPQQEGQSIAVDAEDAEDIEEAKPLPDDAAEKASPIIPEQDVRSDIAVEKKAGDIDVERADDATETQRPVEEEGSELVEVTEIREEPSPKQEASIVVPPDDSLIPEDVDMAESPEAEISLREAVGKRKASEAPSEAARERKRQREDSEAVEEEEPGSSTTKGRRKGVTDKKFQNVINMLHSSISQHRFGNIFHNPIKKQDAADYHDIVKRPMDLKTIKARVKDGTISNALEFQRDIYLMFANAMIYNRPGSEIHAMAEEMMLESEAQINQFRRTQVQIEQLRNTDGYPRV